MWSELSIRYLNSPCIFHFQIYFYIYYIFQELSSSQESSKLSRIKSDITYYAKRIKFREDCKLIVFKKMNLFGQTLNPMHQEVESTDNFALIVLSKLKLSYQVNQFITRNNTNRTASFKLKVFYQVNWIITTDNKHIIISGAILTFRPSTPPCLDSTHSFVSCSNAPLPQLNPL